MAITRAERIHPEHFERPDQAHPAPVIAYASDDRAGFTRARHSHPRGQLLHIVSGSLTVLTDVGTFVVPPERAVWIPPHVEHETHYPIRTALRTLYARPEFGPGLPERPVVIQVTPLLRELILTFMEAPRNYDPAGPVGRLVRVLLDQISHLPVAPLQLSLPVSGRMKEIAEAIIRRPSSIPALSEAAKSCALSERSFERRFSEETGLSYRSWCRQAKLFRALELLASGRSVGDVAHMLGYEGPSSFVATFRKSFGVTPGRYFRGV
ncbi:helix-turn-helix transcriptional regulator [Rhizobiales bacterium]|uniref:AraC family transcriptional regulator n=1 Tax=Hongsoonwoonella zoysiae TaxID=2821844 RepID=UPI0015611EB9|nr:helix-turn-helix transcriptional regulator [Hongsoonwoonella zoysiae]NRG17990.1 helix-turn-helix transcriptional regulator [Hongsoonwoonella zoysiae]